MRTGDLLASLAMVDAYSQPNGNTGADDRTNASNGADLDFDPNAVTTYDGISTTSRALLRLISGRLAAASDFPGVLLDLLIAERYQNIGPRIEQVAIVDAPVEQVEDLPHGWTDEQGSGLYRLKKLADEAAFSYAVGPHSWKRFLFPRQTHLRRSKQMDEGWGMSPVAPADDKYAFLGVRACELAAMEVQHRVFMTPMFTDELYQRWRSQSLIIAVNCTSAAPTCFCTSMNSGAKCRHGFDVALTEVTDAFVVEVGSEFGRGSRIA